MKTRDVEGAPRDDSIHPDNLHFVWGDNKLHLVVRTYEELEDGRWYASTQSACSTYGNWEGRSIYESENQVRYAETWEAHSQPPEWDEICEVWRWGGSNTKDVRCKHCVAMLNAL